MEAFPLYLHLLHFALAEKKEMKKMTERDVLLCNIPTLFFTTQKNNSNHLKKQKMAAKNYRG